MGGPPSKQRGMEDIFQKCIEANRDKIPERTTDDTESMQDIGLTEKLLQNGQSMKHGHKNTHFNAITYYPTTHQLSRSVYKK